MDLSQFGKMLLYMLPLLLVCFALNRINLNKVNRSRQFIMPIVALAYCILDIIFLDFINNLLMKFFDWLAKHFSIFQDLSWQHVAVLRLNLFFVIGFILIKLIILPIINAIWQSDKICEGTSSLFYDKEEDVGKWLLKPNLANYRAYIKSFYIVTVAAAVLIVALYQIFPDSILFQVEIYPVFAVIVLGEVVSFLSGITKPEFVEDILGEDDESYKVANYGVLRKILRELFGDRVLYDVTTDTNSGTATTFEELDELSHSDDSSTKIIGTYFSKLKNNGIDVDINYVKSTINLMNGKSTLFCNPFYKDLTYYLILPLVKQLISYKKCLIILGRDSSLTDVKKWIDSGLESFSNTDSLWQSQVLDEYGNVSDVGIIKFSDIHNLKIHKANSEFLKKVGFVLIIEPSKILASGQIGLSLLVNNCESDGKEIVCCACDRNCDGLVDALSHIFKTNITEVTATENGGGNTSEMYWNADGEYMHHKIFPNISRYLGIGTEINSVAIKYQLDQTGWIGSNKFPVIDMKWIAGQYYRDICQYADLPESQATFDRSFNVYSSLWSLEKKNNIFLVVEDEFQNLFEITRVFASRARSQGFINVISENYLLRDYMLDNVNVFSADPKAIPTIVPDYARTERNMVLKLVMMMVYGMVSEDRIAKELMLCGVTFKDPYEKFKELVIKHCKVKDASLSVRFKEKLRSDSLTGDVIKYYEIDEANELYQYAQSLKNAHFIAEDEEGEKHYIGAKLLGHVFQAMLPGQFITIDGKYYDVQSITAMNGVIVRRAADHITNRQYYRQIREYHLDSWVDGSEMGSKKTLSNIEIIRGFSNISVETKGYLEMNSYGDLANAQKVLINGVPTREYRNKSVLKIKLPNNCTNQICYTICLLLNEIFRTTYPDMYHYISALSVQEEKSEKMSCAMYELSGDCEEKCIYIVEDSDIDLGLIVSVERNLSRYLEIIDDLLVWHNKKMLEKVPAQKEKSKDFTPDFGNVPERTEKKLKAWLKSIKRFFAKLFKLDRLKKPMEEENYVDSFDEENIDEANIMENPENEENSQAVDDNNEDNGTEKNVEEVEVLTELEKSLLANNTNAENEEDEEISQPTQYQKNCFLKFGYENIDDSLDIDGTIEVLDELGFNNNPLYQVRCSSELAENSIENYEPNKSGVHYCDFCGAELYGTEYELLQDGRERCNRCSMTAIRNVEDFKDLYKTVLRNMEAFYGIKINTAIKVRTTNSKKIAKHFGSDFVGTPNFDGRVLGFAQKDKTGYSLYIENGSPKLAASATIAHELTHIWQYLNWNEEDIEKKYGKKNTLAVYEGMAKWAEIQYLMLMNEKAFAKREEIITRSRDDEYGIGFIVYAEKYPLSNNPNVEDTPFKNNYPL